MSIVVVVAPHPDDETLGCGGTLLRHKAEGDSIHWLIMTAMSEAGGFDVEKIGERGAEVDRVTNAYSFDSVHQAVFETTQLDTLPKSHLVREVSSFLSKVKPDTLYIPYRNDAHSDHEVVFDAVAACTKSFRYPFIRKIRAYETLSETEFGLRPGDNGFRPNLFIDVSGYLDHKIAIMKLYQGELGDHPFPRSVTSLRALATLRGATAGCEYAESFMSLKEIW
jgi:N-acetylglucosamine malate deacetylase 1